MRVLDGAGIRLSKVCFKIAVIPEYLFSKILSLRSIFEANTGSAITGIIYLFSIYSESDNITTIVFRCMEHLLLL